VLAPLDVRGRHHRAQPSRDRELGGVADAQARRVLQRDHRARVDRLALAEQERLAATRGLRGRQPLQRRRTRRRAVADADRRGRRRQLDREPRAEERLRRVQHERQRRAVGVGHRVDREVTRVEIERAAAGRTERERRLGVQRVGLEVDARDERERGGLDLGVVVVRVRIAPGHGRDVTRQGATRSRHAATIATTTHSTRRAAGGISGDAARSVTGGALGGTNPHRGQ